ncbi:hypothetical protein [Falsirhodobacter xinxiangensis]|uniref:hypothetical protein n=1 Tax=Falsirhodobacter xinxiangensis TaxID=2530049 RepID=UPI00145B6BB4|nr:hypothetical protein [Rhodobacter xinxiangensis]
MLRLLLLPVRVLCRLADLVAAVWLAVIVFAVIAAAAWFLFLLLRHIFIGFG